MCIQVAASWGLATIGTSSVELRLSEESCSVPRIGMWGRERLAAIHVVHFI